jgi:phosphatidate cytidylyltransferase
MSNLSTRVIVAIVGIPLLLFTVIYGGLVLLAFTVLLSAFALWEFYGMFMQKGYSPGRISMIIFSAFLFIVTQLMNADHLIAVLIIAFVYSAVSEVLRDGNRDPFNVAIDMLGLIYVSIPLSMLNDLASDTQMNFALYVFLLIWSCDTFAYFGGRMFGKTPMSPISPNKTAEGGIAGLVMTLGVSLLLHFLFPENISMIDAIILGVTVGIMSEAGDLFESLLKRYCGVKNSSDLIPGHGGVLDRFDSLLFSVPVVFIYLNNVRQLLIGN